MNRRLTCLLLAALIIYLVPVRACAADARREAAEILRATGVQGGSGVVFGNVSAKVVGDA